MIYVMYDYSEGKVQVFRDGLLEFELECTTAEATVEIRNRYGMEAPFVPLTSE